MFNNFKVLAATLALGASVLGASAANANPISFYLSTDGTNYTQFGTTTTTGSNVATLSGQGYSVTATGLGSPLLAAPNFQSTSLDFLATGSGTFYVMAVETGLTTPNITGFSLGFTNNAGSTVSVTESFGLLLGSSTTPTILSSAVLARDTARAFNISAPNLPAVYGVAEIYSATFSGNGGTVNATISEAGVPEPMSLSLLGAGLVGLGMIRRRSNKSA